ncbi:MAG: thiamine phosphate synthase [Methanobrevibacter sp.]|jgi:thiamine-phosphate pyrophosphorylase|nr:thiamine phosphate synthase [Methanobrevibacter sp.]
MKEKIKEKIKNIDYSLYLVTNRENKTNSEFLNIIEEAILGGVTVVQIREKTAPTGEFYKIAKETKKITDSYDIPLIINDRLDVALAIDASGVHVGQSDMPAQIVRDIIGEEKILGVSAATIETAISAEKDSADYIGSGAISPTKTKDADCISLDYLKKIVDSVNIPVIAIGGISEDTVNLLDKTEIKGISVVSAIMNSYDPKKSSKNLKNEFNKLK